MDFDWSLLGIVLVCLGALVALILLRGLSGGKLEVKLSDAVIAILPFVLFMLFTGQIRKLVVSSEGVTVEMAEAFRAAAAAPISGQVSALPIIPVDLAAKGPVDEIPRLIADGVEGLTFELGFGSYNGPAIREYLLTLTRYPTFRYVVFTNPDGRLFGMIDARKLATVLQEPDRGDGFENLADVLNSGADDQIAQLPGFLPAESAVPAEADKLVVLQQMEDRAADWLPIADADGRFRGVVERSRLTASLILDVAQRLDAPE